MLSPGSGAWGGGGSLPPLENDAKVLPFSWSWTEFGVCAVWVCDAVPTSKVWGVQGRLQSRAPCGVPRCLGVTAPVRERLVGAVRNSAPAAVAAGA